MLSGKDQELAGLKSTLSGKDKEVEGLQNALNAKDAELADLRKKIDASSMSVPTAQEKTTPEAPLQNESEPQIVVETTAPVVPPDEDKTPTEPPVKVETPPEKQIQDKAPHKNWATNLISEIEEKVEERIHGTKPPDPSTAPEEKIEDKIHGTNAQDSTQAKLGPGLLIDSYPLKKPKFHILMDDTKQSVDLSATEFHIHATLERTSAGIELVVQAGATVNIRLSEKQKWQRYTGGSRVTTVAGMILFDPVGAMNARLDNSSG
ncbi:hypothetical protein [Acidicapsa acidisoli]|uniref:hypothetical protein n=1 Tax=Acidicapsa acidisoli TaxID=1615681 RepID=UPI0021E026B4|nr:hypothetical protein [Acidicapsa acidisoli]